MSDASAPAGWVDNLAFGAVMVGLSSVGFGLVPYFARSLTDAGIAPPAIAFFRYTFAAVAFLPFLRLRGEAGTATLWGYCTGFGVGLGWVGYVKALTLLPVSVAGVFYMTYPLFTLIVGWLVFRDRPGLRSVFGGLMILGAAALAARSANELGSLTLTAILLAFSAPLAFGLSINVLARKLVILPPLSRMSAFALGSSTGLLPLIATYPRAEVLPATADQWTLAVALGIIAALLPQFIYSTFVPKIGGAKAAALGSIELPTMFAVGYFAFGEAIGWREALAGALVLAAIFLTPSRRPPASVTATASAPSGPQ
jgi:drug/metabolite transporter (DMT)-like permease